MALLRTAAQEQLSLTEAGDDAEAMRMAVEVRYALQPEPNTERNAARVLGLVWVLMPDTCRPCRGASNLVAAVWQMDQGANYADQRSAKHVLGSARGTHTCRG